MLDDIRGHDPRPTDEEREWISSPAYGFVARVVLATGVALMLGVSAGALFERYGVPTIASSAASTPNGSPAASR